MRIGFVAYHGSVHTRRWASHYAAAGFDVHVVTCGGGEFPPAGYRVHDLGPPRFGKAGYLLRLPAARRALARIDPDIVHAHWLTSYGLLALASGKRPLVVTAHGDDVLIAPRNPLLRLIVARVLRAAEFVTVPSEQMRQAVHELVGTDTTVEVFQYGVETERLAAVAADARRARSPETTVRIVSARPLLQLYRFDALLEALALLDVRGLAWRCELFGDGPERAELESLARTLEIEDRVAFRGQRPAREVEVGLAGADLYVSVAESDGASIALLEALALGPVPVLSDIPANRSWVEDGTNGVLTAIEPQAISVAIERALTLDPHAVRTANELLVRARGDLDRNLSRLERRLGTLVSPARVPLQAGAAA